MTFFEIIAEVMEKIVFAVGLAGVCIVVYFSIVFLIDLLKPIFVERSVEKSKAVKSAVALLEKERAKNKALKEENERLLQDVSFFQNEREFYKKLAFPEKIRTEKKDGKSIYSTPVEVKK